MFPCCDELVQTPNTLNPAGQLLRAEFDSFMLLFIAHCQMTKQVACRIEDVLKTVSLGPTTEVAPLIHSTKNPALP